MKKEGVTSSGGGDEAVRPLQHAWNFHGSTVDRSKSYEDNQRLVGACDTVESFWRNWRALAKPSQLFRTAAQLDAVRGAPPLAHPFLLPAQLGLIRTHPRSLRAGIEPPATQQPTVEALCLFKHGIQPQWEDPANAAGGQWNWRPNVDQQDKGAGLDALWEELVLAMIGGIAFGGCADICGLRVVDKSRPAWPKGKGRQQRGRATCSYRFELWFSSGYKTDESRADIAKQLEDLLSAVPGQSGLDFALKMHQQSLTQEAAYVEAKATYAQEKAAQEKAAAAAAAAAEKEKEKGGAAAGSEGAVDADS
jgi:hypothetical protein